MITFQSKGSLVKTERFLNRMSKLDIARVLTKYGEVGRNALASATPRDSGIAAESWSFRIVQNGSSCNIIWTNSDNENGFPVAIMLQYGYGTGTGGYVQGRDYINPAIKPVFEQILRAVREEVTRA